MMCDALNPLTTKVILDIHKEICNSFSCFCPRYLLKPLLSVIPCFFGTAVSHLLPTWDVIVVTQFLLSIHLLFYPLCTITVSQRPEQTSLVRPGPSCCEATLLNGHYCVKMAWRRTLFYLFCSLILMLGHSAISSLGRLQLMWQSSLIKRPMVGCRTLPGLLIKVSLGNTVEPEIGVGKEWKPLWKKLPAKWMC